MASPATPPVEETFHPKWWFYFALAAAIVTVPLGLLVDPSGYAVNVVSALTGFGVATAVIAPLLARFRRDERARVDALLAEQEKARAKEREERATAERARVAQQRRLALGSVTAALRTLAERMGFGSFVVKSGGNPSETTVEVNFEVGARHAFDLRNALSDIAVHWPWVEGQPIGAFQGQGPPKPWEQLARHANLPLGAAGRAGFVAAVERVTSMTSERILGAEPVHAGEFEAALRAVDDAMVVFLVTPVAYDADYRAAAAAVFDAALTGKTLGPPDPTLRSPGSGRPLSAEWMVPVEQAGAVRAGAHAAGSELDALAEVYKSLDLLVRLVVAERSALTPDASSEPSPSR